MQQFIVQDQVPDIAIGEADVQVFVYILFVNRHTRLELHHQDLSAVFVIGKEIGAPPVVWQSDAVEPVINQDPRELVVVVCLFLLAIQFVVINPDEFHVGFLFGAPWVGSLSPDFTLSQFWIKSIDGLFLTSHYYHKRIEMSLPTAI